jgi:hypothetical protein
MQVWTDIFLAIGRLMVGRSKQRSEKVAEPFFDCRWRSLADVRFILGEDRYRWPKIKRGRDPRVCRIFHELHPTCWIDPSMPAEAHHGAAGSRGKSDELCILFALSKRWHEVVGSSELPLGRLLWLKLEHDFCHTDWLRMTLLFNHFLPDPEPFRDQK